jgi:hypothetical protein
LAQHSLNIKTIYFYILIEKLAVFMGIWLKITLA